MLVILFCHHDFVFGMAVLAMVAISKSFRLFPTVLQTYDDRRVYFNVWNLTLIHLAQCICSVANN